MEYRKIIVDVPRPKVQRITLNRPDKRNPLSNELRGELFHALEAADNDAEHCRHDHSRCRRVFFGRLRSEIQCRRGPTVSHGRRARELAAPRRRRIFPDVGSGEARDRAGARLLPRRRHRTRDRVRSRLRRRGREDRLSGRARNQSTGQPVLSVDRRSAARDGTDADRAIRCRGSTRSSAASRIARFRSAELEGRVLDIAERVAKVPSDLQQFNKRAVHRQMDAMGIRAGIRAGTEMQALATFTRSTQAHLAELRQGLTEALTKRDQEFGDYRTTKK